MFISHRQIDCVTFFVNEIVMTILQDVMNILHRLFY